MSISYAYLKFVRNIPTFIILICLCEINLIFTHNKKKILNISICDIFIITRPRRKLPDSNSSSIPHSSLFFRLYFIFFSGIFLCKVQVDFIDRSITSRHSQIKHNKIIPVPQQLLRNLFTIVYESHLIWIYLLQYT